jgi:hypothetical protein
MLLELVAMIGAFVGKLRRHEGLPVFYLAERCIVAQSSVHKMIFPG